LPLVSVSAPIHGEAQQLVNVEISRLNVAAVRITGAQRAGRAALRANPTIAAAQATLIQAQELVYAQRVTSSRRLARAMTSSARR